MNASELEQFRLSLLRYLDRDGSDRFGLPTAFLKTQANNESQGVTYDQTERELVYLMGAGLVEEIKKLLSPENRSWKLTKAGRDFLAQNSPR